MVVEDWADFISSKFDGMGAVEDDDVRGGDPTNINLKTLYVAPAANQAGTPGSGTIKGTINEAVDDIDDVDVFWVGALTPESVLSLKVTGTFESPNAPGVFNDVTVTLHPFVTGAEKSAAETPGMSKTEDYDEYKGLNCGLYYVEVSGATGGYDLSWTFTE